jgi:hypothetical protein
MTETRRNRTVYQRKYYLEHRINIPFWQMAELLAKSDDRCVICGLEYRPGSRNTGNMVPYFRSDGVIAGIVCTRGTSLLHKVEGFLPQIVTFLTQTLDPTYPNISATEDAMRTMSEILARPKRNYMAE